jgi:hypothetical protein
MNGQQQWASAGVSADVLQLDFMQDLQPLCM